MNAAGADPGTAARAGGEGADRAVERSPTRLLVLALLGVGVGALLHLAGVPTAARWTWAAVTGLVLAPAAWEVARALRRGETGVDVVAVLAMLGALALGELLAGAVIAVMLAGGTALERFAVARARRELTALCAAAPRVAHERVGEDVRTVPVEQVEPGARLLVKPGEVLPVDGILLSPSAVLDEAALTGEARPVEVVCGTPLRSGATNAGAPLELRATASAAESTYAGIVRLVSAAEASRAPFVRLANRYARGFLVLTVALAAGAWIATRDPVRALAVLVVATPCPLILAAPAAIVAGVSRAARSGIIVKGGAPLEALARASVILLDKTGTVTAARPRVIAVERFGALESDELVQLAASVEQVSLHPVAPAILAEARHRGLDLSFPEEAREAPGSGIVALVGGRQVAVGQLAWVAQPPHPAEVRAVSLRTAIQGVSGVFVAVEGRLAGALLLQDPIRPEAPRVLRDLRRAGVARLYMVTGDHPDIAELVGDAIGVDRVFAERTPEEKVEVVQGVRGEGLTAMVGDGLNDAPALALADVGIAMGARGATAASEAADVVLTADRLEGLLLAVQIAQRTTRIARESVWVGMGLSFVAMGAAALGLLPPVAGALLQEGIDVLVILNALRALGGPAPRRPAGASALARELADAHEGLRPRIEELASLAARLDALAPEDAAAELARVRAFLVEEVLPHEEGEQRAAYPVVVAMLGSEDPTGPLVQTHHEIRRLVRLYERLLDRLPPGGPGPEDRRDLRRALYGLNAILALHLAQEEELYCLLDA
ncbi:MAG: heavy metal translocating P-type ATPase [Planctomycetota bacterium]